MVKNGVDADGLAPSAGLLWRSPAAEPHTSHLNLPKKDDQETLAEIKSLTLLKRTPVLVFSASKAGDDIRQSHELHAKLLFRQTGRLHEFVNVMWQKTIHHDYANR